MNTTGARQRLRLTFSRGEDARYITHLDMMRLWERMVRRARLPISYSAARPPRPRLALGAPLAVGVTSEGEMVDMFLDTRLPAAQLAQRLALECPPGLAIKQVQEVGLALPSLQSLVSLGEYRVTVAAHIPVHKMQERVAEVLAAASLPRERVRDKEIRRYDLRPQISNLWITTWGDDGGVLGMLLQTDEQATGRPDEVLAVLGLSEAERAIHRVKLVLATLGAPKPSEAPPVSARDR
jgi:radical SAM-linked protein